MEGASSIQTLDELNEAFTAWADYSYNRRYHSELNQSPLERWRASCERIEYVEEEALRLAFLWSEKRTPDKSGVFSLFGTRYQVGPELARKRIEVRFDPEQLDEVEVWYQGSFRQRVRPFQVQTHRRPKPKTEDKPAADGPMLSEPVKPLANWLGFLVERRLQEGFVEPAPRTLTKEHADQRAARDQALLDLLAAHLDPAAYDEDIARDYIHQYGPFVPERAGDTLRRLLDREPNDRHVTFYLDAIRREQQGATP